MTSNKQPPAEAADERISKILEAALAEFSEQGYAAASLISVARRASVSLRTVVRHFPSRDDLFREVVRWTVLNSLGHNGHADSSNATAAEQVRDFARRYWTTMERPELIAMIRLTIGELPRFPELAVFHAAESLERVLHELERIITRGVARGELRCNDIRASARTLLATLAAHTLWFAYPDIYSGLTGADREHAAAATIETLIRSLGPTAHGPPQESEWKP